jgi:hypothetical protein
MATTTKKPRKKRGPNLKTRSKLLGAGTATLCHDGWIAVNATSRQMFSISQRHIDKGVPKDPERCIVGLALHDGIGEEYVYVVGVSITKIIDEENRVFARFVTPKALGDQIKAWEGKRLRGLPWGEWKLKPGVQVLGALPESWRLMYEGKDKKKKRAAKAKRAAEKRDVEAGLIVKPARKRRRAAITRVVRRVSPIMT